MSDLPTFDVVAGSIRELGLQLIGVLPPIAADHNLRKNEL
jgi:hypothetical protein